MTMAASLNVHVPKDDFVFEQDQRVTTKSLGGT